MLRLCDTTGRLPDLSEPAASLVKRNREAKVTGGCPTGVPLYALVSLAAARLQTGRILSAPEGRALSVCPRGGGPSSAPTQSPPGLPLPSLLPPWVPTEAATGSTAGGPAALTQQG